MEDPILIVEGMSDVAAALDIGVCAIGKPSAHSGDELLVELLEGVDHLKHIVIIGENDEAGRSGAHNTVAALRGVCKSLRIIFPPDKVNDLRQWVVDGKLKRDDFLNIVHSTEKIESEPVKGEEPAETSSSYQSEPYLSPRKFRV